MRNRLIYGYDTVDLNLLWHSIEFDVPALAETLSREVGKAR